MVDNFTTCGMKDMAIVYEVQVTARFSHIFKISVMV